MKHILLMLDGDPQPSVFDAVVAADCGVDVLLRHGGVRPEQVRSLVHGAIFTRGPAQLKHTALFVGGGDVAAAEAILRAAVDSFFGPMRVSAMLDANGSNTTAAAAVLALRRHVVLRGAIVAVLGGTGPVGRRVARLLASEGARVRVGSRKLVHAEATCDRLAAAMPGAELTPVATDSRSGREAILDGARAIVACGAAGVELLDQPTWSGCQGLEAVVDLNAVPPAGLAGVDPADAAAFRNNVLCYGAIGVGGQKMKIHKAALARLFSANNLVLDADEIYALGKEMER